MEQRQSDRKGLARKFFRKVSGIAGLLRSPSKRRSDSSFTDSTLDKSSDRREIDLSALGTQDSPKAEQIPALHAVDVQISSLSEVQLSDPDSLEVASSEWSQTKSARRKQRRKGNTNHLKQLEATPAASMSGEDDTALQMASIVQDSVQDGGINRGKHSVTPVSSADADTASGNASRVEHINSKLVPRPASPLGKKSFEGFKGRTARQGKEYQSQLESAAAMQPLTRQRQTQADADDLILAQGAVSRARQVNADLCQVERSQRSGSPAHMSPRKTPLDIGLVSRASSDSRLVSQLSSATSLVRVDSAELPQLTEPEMIHKVVKKIKAMYGSCSNGESGDVIHMLGSIQATLKAYAASESLWLADQPSRVRQAYLCKCFPGTDAKVVHTALHTSKGCVEQASLMLERKGLSHVPSAFCLKEVFQSVQKMSGVEWVVVWDTCALMRDQWVGYQLLEESRVYQVIPFMTHLELNHIKDDKMDSEKAHKGQEAVKLVNAGLQPEYRGRFKLQPEYGEPTNSHDFLPSLTADRDKHIGDDLILQCAAFWDHRAQELSKRMIFFTNDIALSNRAIALGMETSQASQWLKHQFS